MKISVAVPCYNGAQYLARNIESLLEQTRVPDQILIVDDGSQDSSGAIVEKYPVELITHERNRGLAVARNTALQNSTGDVLVYIDADTLAAPDLIEVLVSGYADDDPYLAGVGGQGVEVAIHSRADRWRRAHASQRYGPRARDVPFLYGLCMSFRTHILRQIGGFSPEFSTNAEDMDVGLRLTRSGYRLRYLPGAIVFHQRQDDEASLKRTMIAWYQAAYIAKWRNHAHPCTLHLGTLRRLVMDPLTDILIARDFSLVPLSVKLNLIKLWALLLCAKGRCK
jgi:glycosyltransferase involved in cell wall biosynthesis